MALKALVATKIGMTSLIDDKGIVSAVTLLSVDNHTISKIMDTDHNGYNAVQVGVGKSKKSSKSIAGQYKKLKIIPKIIREFRILSEELSSINVGETLLADVFSIGDIVNVSGVSKGKGWAGTIKRHNFHRGRKTHGGRSYRRVGSIGSMYPQHILKGKKMAGRMGHATVTIKNMKVAVVEPDKQLIGLYGSVPGPRKGIVKIRGLK